jgi:transcriptional regulator with XRE-family HTH domain
MLPITCRVIAARHEAIYSPFMSALHTAGYPVNVGERLRFWRRQRGLSQLQLSLVSAISTRHLSFVETGRAKPSREMVMHLAEQLDVPLRERNSLLLAGGFAPTYRERALDDDEMAPAREALERFLHAHEPYPALVIDERWNLMLANDALQRLMTGVAPELLEPPANTLRIALHPDGMAPYTINFAEWSAEILHRIQLRATLTADPELEQLYEELRAYPNVGEQRSRSTDPGTYLMLPLRLRRGDGELSFLSTISTFVTATDITLAGLAIEAFYPATQQTADILLDLSRAESSAADRYPDRVAVHQGYGSLS